MKIYTNGDTEMADAVNKVYGGFAMPIENGICLAARDLAKDYEGGQWSFVTNDEGDLGFWYPGPEETFDVSVPSNYYSNSAMPAVAFGAGLTLLLVNQLAWKLDEMGLNDDAKTYGDMYHRLTSYVFDLSESGSGFMDGAAVAGFID